jgi:hypothetical protein
MMTRKELRKLEKDLAKKAKEETRGRKPNNGTDFVGRLFIWFLGLGGLFHRAKTEAPAAGSEPVKKEKKNGEDSFSSVKESFAPVQAPKRTPEKYPRPIDNLPVWAAALILSAVAAVAINVWWLIHIQAKGMSFAMQLLLLSVLFGTLFFLLLKLASFVFPPFNYDKNLLIGYRWQGKIYDVSSAEEDLPGFGLRLGDIFHKIFFRYPAGHEFPQIETALFDSQNFLLVIKEPEIEFLKPASLIASLQGGYGEFLQTVEKDLKEAVRSAFVSVYKFSENALEAINPADHLNAASLKNKLDEVLAECGGNVFRFVGYNGDPEIIAGSFGKKIPRAQRLAAQANAEI